jgi:hypothetical protein
MAKDKAKWLKESTIPELIALLGSILNGEMDEKEITKAQKIVKELSERLPAEDAPASVTEELDKLLEAVTKSVASTKKAYESEIAASDDPDGDEDEDEEEEEEEAPKSKKGKSKEEAAPKEDKKKSSKKEEPAKSKGKSKKDEDEEDEEDEDDEEGEGGDDYSDWSLKALKTECRKRGIKVNKGMKKTELIKKLEADDKE